jgi:hypothetical protein
MYSWRMQKILYMIYNSMLAAKKSEVLLMSLKAWLIANGNGDISISISQLAVHFLPPFELPPLPPPFEGLGFGELFPRLPPDGLPVVLGAFFNPLDLAIYFEFDKRLLLFKVFFQLIPTSSYVICFYNIIISLKHWR